jgi:8-oxo-dGTP pyrophosphatase MutT (NUDIX family)
MSRLRARAPAMANINRRSFGIIPIAVAADGPPLFLILRAYAKWDFPKGGPDPGETPLQTARRELLEETGIGEFTLAWGEVSMDTLPYSGGKVATYFPARVKKQVLTLPVSPELGRPEHEEYRWVGYHEARMLLPPRLTALLDWAQGLLGDTGRIAPGHQGRT